jgi:glycosyltransferase involved in cell wall biosynthesis
VQGPRTLPADAVVEVHGWAWFERDELASCFVTVDGEVAAPATLGPAPPDVAASRPEAERARRCSWRAEVDLRPHLGRTVEIGAVATSKRGVAQFLPASRVEVVAAHGGIEQPPSGARVRAGRVRITGWALHGGSLPSRLTVRVNGRDAGLARPFAIERPDLAADLGAPDAPIAGFEHLIDVDGEHGTSVRVDVDLVPADGPVVPLRGTTLVVAPEGPPIPRPRVSDVLTALPDAVRVPPAGAPLRLAVFTHSLELGGGQLYLQELLWELLKNHDASCLVVSRTDGPLRDELESLGATVHVTDYPLPGTAAYEARTVELAALVRGYDTHVVVVNTLISAIGADVAGRVGCPAVWAIHESYTLDDYWAATCSSEQAPSCAAANAATLADTSVVLFEADATRAVYAAAAGGERMATLHYGIDLEAIDGFARTMTRAQARAATGVADDRELLVCLGTFEARKGQALLVAAFAGIADECPNATLALVGATDTGYARGLTAFVKRLGLDGRILVVDAEAQPFRWYRAADGVVLASDLESMPRVLLEAMAFELPVVATEVWGIPELVRPGENGLLCPPRNSEALAEALRAFLGLGPDARRQLGVAGSHLVRARHDLAEYRRVFARLLQRVVDDPDASVSRLLAP